ncbi:MAG: signal recognition particle protein [Ruminococcaceae bacterium]|nr:signal recognition particle protein [Oscillospiraceae bacterium]
MFDSLREKLDNVFKSLRGKGKLTQEDVKLAMRQVRLSLLEADVNFKVVKDLVAKITERAVGTEVLESLTPAQMVIKIVNEELIALMGSGNEKIKIADRPPTVILLAGLQGAGKTTTAAKLALHLRKQGKKPLLTACDVYRPAAIDQLKTLGAGLNIPVFTIDGSKDAVKIAKDSLDFAARNLNDIVIIDTAGRLHIDDDMMDEIKRINAAVNPTEVLLVIDALSGQDAVNSAKAFDEALALDGLILTKLDGDSRGGAALSVRAVVGKPVKFAAVGEKPSDLEPFYPERMVSRILGMGDVLSLIERVSQEVDEKKALELEEKLRENRGMDYADYLIQLQQIQKMGSIKDLLGFLPGINKKAIDEANIDENKFVRSKAIIQSMTEEERTNPKLMSFSRKKRIAAGSGTTIQDINSLTKELEMMNKMMKEFKNNKKFARKMKGMMSSMGMKE